MTPLTPVRVTLALAGEAHHAAVHAQLQGPGRQAARLLVPQLSQAATPGPPEALGPAEQAAVLLAHAPRWLMAASLGRQQQPRCTSMKMKMKMGVCLLEEDDPSSSFHLIPACSMAVVYTRGTSQTRTFL